MRKRKWLLKVAVLGLVVLSGIALCRQIIAQKAGPFDPGRFRDRYEEALRELIARKMEGEKIVAHLKRIFSIA